MFRCEHIYSKLPSTNVIQSEALRVEELVLTTPEEMLSDSHLPSHYR